MEEMSHEDAISTFQSITGADEKTAEHVLEAHAWDLNRGVNFFMESANSIPAAQADFDVNGQRGKRPANSMHTSVGKFPKISEQKRA